MEHWAVIVDILYCAALIGLRLAYMRQAERSRILFAAALSVVLFQHALIAEEIQPTENRSRDATVSILLELLKTTDGDALVEAAGQICRLGAKEAIPAFRRLLRHNDHQIRVVAVDSLQELGARDAILDLCSLVADKSAWVRASVAVALGKLGASNAQSELTQMLRDESELVRGAAAWALGRLGLKEAVSAIAELLNDKVGHVRAAAALALGTLGAKETIEMLGKLLEDSDKDVSWKAAFSLAQMDRKEGLLHLRKLLVNESGAIQVSSVEALARLGDKESIPALMKLLNEGKGLVRARAAFALGSLGATEASRDLQNVFLSNDFDLMTLGMAIEALGKLKAQDAVVTIKAALGIKHMLVRRSAIRALGAMGDKSSLPVLKALLHDPEFASSRIHLMWGLASLGEKVALDELKASLRSSETPLEVRVVAIQAVAELNQKDVIPLLKEQLESGSSQVRNAAVEALSKLTDK